MGRATDVVIALLFLVYLLHERGLAQNGERSKFFLECRLTASDG
eukprot:COSAG01_NODE_859_length_13066_cov_83.717822_3_plen_44_part_00